MHSWRVLILPWLEQAAIYNRYRFDEPWDGPNNRKLHDLIVPAYSCPSHPGKGHPTAYVAVRGPQTAWRGAEPTKPEDFKDGPEQTIQVVETAAPIHWMEPRDLPFDQMSFTIGGPENSAGISSGHPGGANFLLGDGSVRFFYGKMATYQLGALLTVAGGEKMEGSE